MELNKYKKEIIQLSSLSKNKEYFQESRNKINKKIKDIDSNIQRLLEDNEFSFFLEEKLQEGIEKFNLNETKGKSGEQSLECSYKSTNAKGEATETVYLEKNPRAAFIPSKDDWEFVSLEKNDNGEFKLTVDNVKGREHIGAFNWFPDYYYTDWFKI